MLTRKFARKQIEIVAYAIENSEIANAFAQKTKLALPIARAIVRFAVSKMDRFYSRIAFGTDGARELYESMVGYRVVKHSQFTALEPKCECIRSRITKVPGSVIFLGSFERRKGLPQLLSAWDRIMATDESNIPERLRILGQGPLQQEVREFARFRSEVEITEEPSRTDIHKALCEAQILVLLSQPNGTWREQIGLPIVEALSHGCTVVSSSETGIANWLAEHGHRVLSPDVGSLELVEAIMEALRSPLDPTVVLDSLPAIGGREQAEQWMIFGGSSHLGV